MIVRREDGAGGKYMSEFLKEHIFSFFDSKICEISLSEMEDSTDFHSDFVLTTDSYTAFPPIFKGGSIGKLAICGTANDLAVMGAEPKYLALSLIIQEGFAISDLRKIIRDMRDAMDLIDLEIITGDTKVVDSNIGLFINTSGIGRRNSFLEKNLETVRNFREYPWRWVRDCGLNDGDVIIVSGNIAEHGLTMLLARESIDFEIDVKSDVFPVWVFVKEALKIGGITAMKDPTRGGISACLNEMAEKSGVGILIDEKRVPVREDVRAVCDALGIDVFSMANEGKVVFGVIPDMAEDVLESIKKHDENAEIIGYATSEFKEVVVETRIGTKKVLSPPFMDPIPRVC